MSGWCLLTLANTINIAADLAAMSDAVKLVIGGPRGFYSIVIGISCLLLQIFIPYKRYVHILKWLTLSLFAYVGTVFASHVDWSSVIRETFLPHISLDANYVLLVVGMFGTTISPYLFFWQAAQEIEEQHRHHAKPLFRTPANAGPELRRIRIDTLTGMAFSSLISLAIVFATAATLHANGITDIQTSSQAAEALRPIAGDLAFALFALGIVGTGILAVPVLAGSAAYAITEMMGRSGSLAARPMQAKFFYGAIAGTTLVGGLINMGGIDPAKALYWAAVVNGILAAPLMVVMMLIVRNKKAMGDLVLPHRATLWGWAATAVMAAATAIFFWFVFFPG